MLFLMFQSSKDVSFLKILSYYQEKVTSAVLLETQGVNISFSLSEVNKIHLGCDIFS